MARPSQGHDWAARRAPSLAELDSLIREAFACLPQQLRALCATLIIVVEDFPSDVLIEDMGLDSPFELLCLFEGQGLGLQFSISQARTENKIIFFRRPILDYWVEHDEPLGEILSHILATEIGHHFGLSEDAIEAFSENLPFDKYIKY